MNPMDSSSSSYTSSTSSFSSTTSTTTTSSTTSTSNTLSLLFQKYHRKLVFNEEWNFDGYEPTAINPGMYMLIFTVIICFLLTLLLPVIVVLGKRYEKKRIREEEAALLFAASSSKDGGAGAGVAGAGAGAGVAVREEDEEDNMPPPPSGEKKKKRRSRRKHKKHHGTGTGTGTGTGGEYNDMEAEADLESSSNRRHRIPRDKDTVTFSLPEEGDYTVPPPHSNSQQQQQQQQHRYEDRSVMTKSTKASRTSKASRKSVKSAKSGVSDSHSVMTGMTSSSSYIHGRSSTMRSGVVGGESDVSGGGTWKNLVDKVIMPPYQDDESKSVLTREDRSVLSNTKMSRHSAATLASVVSIDASGPTTTTSTTYTQSILDTRSTRRRGRLFNNTGDNRTRRSQKQSKREEITSPYSNNSNGGSGSGLGHYVKSGRSWSDTKSDIVGGISSSPNGVVGTGSVGGFGGSGGRIHHNYGRYPKKGIKSNQTVSSEMYTTQSQISRYSTSSQTTTSRKSRFSFGRYTQKRSHSPVSMAPSIMSRIEDDISPNDAADANDPGKPTVHNYDPSEDEFHVCCGKNALWRPAILKRGLDHLIDIAQPDNETRRILKLGIPFTLATVMESVFENVELALVGNFVGTDALTAYALSDLLAGTTGEFIGGLYDSAMTVCPHAIGAGNNYLCGQYLQITVWLYAFASIPECAFWWYYMSDLIQWFGLSKEVGDLAQNYTRVAMFGDILEELADIFHGLLEITEHEAFSATIGIVEGLVGVTIVCYMLYFYELTLIEIAFINIVLTSIFFTITILISWKYGWVKEYTAGMFQNFALKNKVAVKNVLNTAWPLALGSLLAYAEWEVLTVFARFLGPAEVAAWAVLGYIWETFEASTEGIGDGAEVRVAYHLGKGQPEMARISSQKSMLLGTIFATFLTSIFFIIGDTLPTWFTTDVVLQKMIRDLLPMIGIGNISMTFGMMCWAIIGAQGRYRLATLVAFISTWGVTLPLAAVFTFVFQFDLQGITSAVVIGYSVACTVMSYIVLRSDWERLSKIIIELNMVTGGVDSSDSEGEYSSSSSSSSSSDSDDDDDDEDF